MMNGSGDTKSTVGGGTRGRGGVSRRTVIKGAAAGLAAAAASSAVTWRGAVAQSKKLVVTTMPGPRWELALKASAKAYMEKNKDVEIEVLVSPYAEHYQRIGTSLIEDSSDFDAHLFDPVLIGQSYPKLLPLTEYFDQDPEWRDYYLNGVPYFYRGSWDWDGVPYSIVHDANCMMTWWRKDVFEAQGLAEPATFETILANAQKLNAAKPGSGFMTCAARNAWFLGMTYTGMMWGFGGKWYENDKPDAFGRLNEANPPGKVLLDSPENLAAMTMLRDLSKVWNEASLNAQEFENAEAFKNDVSHQQVMWSGFMILQNPKENPNFHDKLVSRDFPIGGSNQNVGQTGMKGGFGLAIPKASKNIELMVDFAKFVTRQENAENFILAGGQPSNATLLNEWGAQPQYQVFKSIAQGIANGHHLAQFAEGPEFFQIITQHAGDVVTGKAEPEQACANMKKDVEVLFQRSGYA
ncbi:MAG: ABC transporter substrate-binding protein [Alphaproteobacteria bacterium]